MILSVHAVAGATIASFFPGNPALAFGVAFASHFVLDAIPHKDYSINSYVSKSSNRLESDILINGKFGFDLAKIFLDFFVGVFLSVAIFSLLKLSDPTIIYFGIAGGVAPDGLQFVYMKTRWKILSYLQRFHIFIHHRPDLSVSVPVGLLFQALIIIPIVAVGIYFL